MNCKECSAQLCTTQQVLSTEHQWTLESADRESRGSEKAAYLNWLDPEALTIGDKKQARMTQGTAYYATVPPAACLPGAHQCPLPSRAGLCLAAGWYYTGGGGRGGGVRGQKKVCVPNIDLQVRAPLIHFFFSEEKISDVGGWGWSAKTWAGGGGLSTPPPPEYHSAKAYFRGSAAVRAFLCSKLWSMAQI